MLSSSINTHPITTLSNAYQLLELLIGKRMGSNDAMSKARMQLIKEQNKSDNKREKNETTGGETVVELYGASSDLCSRMMHAYLQECLKEKKIKCSFYDVGNGPVFLALQAIGKVPVLKDGNHVPLLGSRDIISHCAEKYGMSKTEDVLKWLESEQKLNSLIYEFVIAGWRNVSKEKKDIKVELNKALDECQGSLSKISQEYQESLSKISKNLERNSCSNVDLTHLSTFYAILKVRSEEILSREREPLKSEHLKAPEDISRQTAQKEISSQTPRKNI